jgi:hypothetical protein
VQKFPENVARKARKCPPDVIQSFHASTSKIIIGLWYARRFARQVISAIEPQMRKALNWWSKRQLERRGLLDLLSNRPSNAYRPDHVDLWFLYRQIRKKRPPCVLEFGAECSTAKLARALYDNARKSSDPVGHLHSVDTVPYWAEITRTLMPKHLQGISTMTVSALTSVEFAGVRVLRHVTVPDVAPDFIYLDGPDFQDFKEKAVCDPIDIERRSHEGFCMVIDGRTENTKFPKDL